MPFKFNPFTRKFDYYEVGVTTFDGLTDTPSSKSGAGKKVVKVNAAETALEYTEEKLGFDSWDKFRDVITFPSADGLVTTIATGGKVEPQMHRLCLCPGPTSGQTTCARHVGSFDSLAVPGKTLTFEYFLDWLTDHVNCRIYMHITDDTSCPPSETARHIGWKIDAASIYASSGDGTTQKITDTGVDLTSSFPLLRLKMVWLVGTSCKFYVNEVLKATHTTNLPPGGQGAYYLRPVWAITTTEAQNNCVEFGRVILTADY